MASGEKAYKSSSSFVTNCINTCVSVAKVIVKSRFGLKLPAATSRSCIVLGNGPSLATSLTSHPDFFKKHELICVNSFSITEEYAILKPQYYVMLDPGFWLGDNALVRDTITAIQKKTIWKIHLFIPPAAKKSAYFQELLKLNPNIQPCYFNYTVFKGFEKIAFFFYKKNLAMPQSQNVLVAALFLSVNLKFTDIYLVGADHSWHESLYVNEDNVLCFKNFHYYENKEVVEYKFFYKGIHTKEIFRIDEIMTTWGKMFYGYVAVNRYSEYCNSKIYNASEISFIDAFKRIKI